MAYGDVDLNLLLVLERLLARQSVSEAAEDLGLSASATSRALQRLRETLGDPLLVRAGNQLVATELARELLGPTGRAVEAAREVFERERSCDPAQASGEFVLAMTAELQQALLPDIYEHVRSAAPGVELRVRELGMHSPDEGRRDLIHLAIGPDLSVLPNMTGLPDLDDFVRRDLYTRHFVVVGAAEAWPDTIDLDAYLAADHVIMSNDGSGRGFMDDLLAQQGLQRRVSCAVTSFAAVLELVRATRLLALVPSEVLPALGEGVVHHPPPLAAPSMAMSLFWHPRHTTQPRHRALRELTMDAVLGCACITGS
ncbi:MAG: LysR family transcriptional regulator [Nannocystales bacterium]